MERQAFPFRPINVASGNKQQGQGLCLGVLKMSTQNLQILALVLLNAIIWTWWGILLNKYVQFCYRGHCRKSFGSKPNWKTMLPIGIRKARSAWRLSIVSSSIGIAVDGLTFFIGGSLVTGLSIMISRERRLPLRLTKMKDSVIENNLVLIVHQGRSLRELRIRLTSNSHKTKLNLIPI